MAFSRIGLPAVVPHHDALTAAMASIGMNFAVAPGVDANIEDTLLFASSEGMDREDLRVVAVLVTWFGEHCSWVNADRLTKLIAAQGSTRVRAFWAALARWKAKDRRFSRLAALYEGPRVDVLSTGTAFQLQRHGEDARFSETCLRVPGNVLRDRPADVLRPSELARHHRTYRSRIQIGPTYRADTWAALEADPDLSAAELARRTYASFATAWEAKRDFQLLHPSTRAKPRRARGKRLS
jgi:hypothetical protein